MDEDLIAAATKAKGNAHAPYSKFSVGAALATDGGLVFTGCNIENASFGLTMCAERVCVGSAVAAGKTKFEAIAIVSDSSVPIVPCGACRQVLAEFNPDLRVISVTTGNQRQEFQLQTLLPNARQGILE